MKPFMQISERLRSVNWIFVAAITIISGLVLWELRFIAMLVIAAIMLTVFMGTPVRFFMRLGSYRATAIMLSMVGGLVAIIILGLLLLPTLFSQFVVLATDIIPRGTEQFIESWNSGEFTEQIPFLQDILSSINFEGFDVRIDNQLITEVITQVSNALGRLSGSVIPLVGGVASAILSVLIIIFICGYLIAEPDRYIRGIIVLSPLWYRQRTWGILQRLDATIRAWLRVTGASMLISAVGTSIGLALLGVEQWAALGVLTGIFSFIPNFGPLMAVIPAMAVAIIQVPEYTWLVLVIIYGVSFVQNQIVGPILASDAMKLAPVMVLIGQIVFGIFFGFLGIMLAVPLTAIMVVLVEEIYVRDILGDRGDMKARATVEVEALIHEQAEELQPATD